MLDLPSAPSTLAAPRTVRGYVNRAAKAARPTPQAEPEAVPLDYETVDWQAAEGGDSPTRSMRNTGFRSSVFPARTAHPTQLVQSAADGERRATEAELPAAHAEGHPRPAVRRAVGDRDLCRRRPIRTISPEPGRLTTRSTLVSAAPEDAKCTVRFRQGFFIGDGTGVGKGRESAAIILDNWMQGRRKAVWISKSDKLLEDAQRDWSALGMERLLVTPLSRFPQGKPITLHGRHPIYDLCHATLRRPRRKGFAGQTDRRMVGLRLRWSGDLRRGAFDAKRRWQQGRAR